MGGSCRPSLERRDMSCQIKYVIVAILALVGSFLVEEYSQMLFIISQIWIVAGYVVGDLKK